MSERKHIQVQGFMISMPVSVDALATVSEAPNRMCDAKVRSRKCW